MVSLKIFVNLALIFHLCMRACVHVTWKTQANFKFLPIIVPSHISKYKTQLMHYFSILGIEKMISCSPEKDRE